jgi:hypothetical protein
MRADATNERRRAALSCRAIEREYGVARSLPANLAREGVLPALRRGRSLLILRTDWETWWTAQSAVADSVLAQRVEQRVAEVLARRGGP